jgi:hypothetical protein
MLAEAGPGLVGNFHCRQKAGCEPSTARLFFSHQIPHQPPDGGSFRAENLGGHAPILEHVLAELVGGIGRLFWIDIGDPFAPEPLRDFYADLEMLNLT